jgi:hypothetical protein
MYRAHAPAPFMGEGSHMDMIESDPYGGTRISCISTYQNHPYN